MKQTHFSGIFPFLFYIVSLLAVSENIWKLTQSET